MEIGNKILELRKKENLSQEQLAEKMNVTRQTISKWELNETTPDIKQAKELSKIFKISLDELTDNDIKSIMEEKISNTEKLAGLIIKILKFMGIALVIFLVIDIIAFICFTATGKLSNVESSAITICSIDNENYEIEFGTNKYFRCDNCSKGMSDEIKKIIDFNNIDNSMTNVENYFKNHNGTCE